MKQFRRKATCYEMRHQAINLKYVHIHDVCPHADRSLSVTFRNASTDGPEKKSRWGETSDRSQSGGLYTHHCTDSGQSNT